jgi:hypothetical protein
MTVLDTNVVSEVMRAEPDDRVVAWMDGFNRRDLGITAITVAEVLQGLGSLPEGERKRQLVDAAATVFRDYLGGRILAFDHRAAVEYSRLLIRRERTGKPISMADAQIAGICLANNADLATRNTRDFEDIGLTLIDPWRDTDLAEGTTKGAAE